MKRTTFTVLGLAAMTFVACNTTPKQEVTPAVKEVTKENIAVETTKQFEEKAMEDCIAYSKIVNDIKLMEAFEAQRVADSIAKAELELKEALAKAEEAKRKRASTPEALAKRAKEAELWFETNYANTVKAYNKNHEGLRVKLTTNGNIYEVALLVNGEWITDQKLMRELEKVEVSNELAPGKAVAITVKNA
ncbi:hypothetical protein U8527_14540 [Kordia algicida OT-1]|uniref:Uncharacterized protein n=1 Tax=Kordia algicida OT-1 TaxID=391587 RepID=A9DYF6_9FLAO|nr:hypothetical protein [Kordia algicida]EDP96126.1 hypothetical protein KAOT1_08153 [Kordia algicida OT-1]